MNLHVIIPYSNEKNLGKAYNEAMERIPDGDWACITDWDILFLLPETISHITGYIERFPDTGLFTCFASRSHVNSVPQMLPGGCSDNDSLQFHTDLARKQTEKLYQVTNINRQISGFVMVVSKATWQKFKFLDNGACLGVDNDFSSRLIKSRLPVRRMDGVYVWHTYRMYSSVRDTSHLIPTKGTNQVKTVYTAIFGKYERLKEPTIVSKGWKYICYTDQPFESNVWEIRQVKSPEDPRRESRKYKALFWNYVETEYSMWVDGSFLINCDLNKFWQSYFRLPFSAPKHPTRKCVYEEIKSVVAAGRGGCEKIKDQYNHYQKLGIPAKNGITTSGVILRQATPECKSLCEEWWNETSKWSSRDQVSFAAVNIGKSFHVFNWSYPIARDLKYIKHSDKYNLI